VKLGMPTEIFAIGNPINGIFKYDETFLRKEFFK
jgi:hypothetical protein